MSEQDGTQVTRKQRKSRQTHKQNGTQPPGLRLLADNDWQVSWKKRGQPWRTEPEIDAQRQQYLTKRLSIKSDLDRCIYPFKDIRLTRADVEWLLATHDNGRGPRDWSDEGQRQRKGLDLRRANLSRESLSGLPLAGVGGETFWKAELSDWPAELAEGQLETGAINLEGAWLVSTHLEGAMFRGAHLEKAWLDGAHLEEACLDGAHLEGAKLEDAHLERATFDGAHLEGTTFNGAHLEGATFDRAHLEGATLVGAHLEGATLDRAHLEGAILFGAHLEGANLSNSFFDKQTNLNKTVLSNKQYGGASLADLHWGDVNVAVIDWVSFEILGDESNAHPQKLGEGVEEKQIQLEKYKTAVRAYRQLAVVLRNQGLSEDANRFAYRAQLMQRKVLWNQRKIGQFLFSLFLDLLAGYSYKAWRSFLAYLIVVTAFATAYFIIGQTVGPALSPIGAWVFSMTSFHGRGFFPGGIKLDDPLTILAAIEAFVGLLIEVTFIATLTRRLFGQ